MKSILDPRFRYTSSVDTDIRKTFARIRREQAAHSKVQVQVAPEAAAVVPINSSTRRNAK
jgi:hypothetical protein